MWSDIFKVLGISAILVGALTWLVKKVFSRHMEYLYDRKTEAFRKELEKYAFEHQIRFSKLHEIRAKVIAELYKLLVAAEGAVWDVVTPLGYEGQASIKDRAKRAWQSIVAFNDYFLKHEIYLDPIDCKPIHKILDDMRLIIIRSGRIEEDVNFWQKMGKKFEVAVRPTKQQIAKDFRKILGVSK